ncbi:hypothetical protein WDU99_09060 [Microbacterium sp. Mu-80]|uniref:Uncharacterized protein n=1 Tax=Microbacterium bandirmense TaxID=3122050 RepID=A0ABU8LBF4_9MICO
MSLWKSAEAQLSEALMLYEAADAGRTLPRTIATDAAIAAPAIRARLMPLDLVFMFPPVFS